MGFKCCVPQCTSSSRNINVFSIPKDCKTRKLWLKAIGIHEESVTSSVRVCARHFEDANFFQFSTCRKLKKGVVPHLHLTADNGASEKVDQLETVKKESNVGSKEAKNRVLSTANKRIKRRLTFRYNRSPCQFSIINFMHNDKKILYYTGIQTYKILCVVFEFILKPEKGPAGTVYQKMPTKRASRIITHSLTPMNEFFLTLMKLRRGFDYQTLADMFQISTSAVSRIFVTWINLMYYKLGSLNFWPHRDILMEHAPQHFLRKYPDVLGSIDCTEFYIETPSSLVRQSQCYSQYKGATTLKSLIMINCNGEIIFVSSLFSGSISDRQIMENSGFNSVLKHKIANGEITVGDKILADKGFNVADLLGEIGITLNIPTFKIAGMQFEPHDVQYIRKIAKERIHVERAIRRLKSFTILSKRIPVSILGIINQIHTVCALLTNFRYPLRT